MTTSWPYIYYIHNQYITFLFLETLWKYHMCGVAALRSHFFLKQQLDPSKWPVFAFCVWTHLRVVRNLMLDWTRNKHMSTLFGFLHLKRSWSCWAGSRTIFLINNWCLKINGMLLNWPLNESVLAKPHIWYFNNSMKVSPGWRMEATLRHAGQT